MAPVEPGGTRPGMSRAGTARRGKGLGVRPESRPPVARVGLQSWSTPTRSELGGRGLEDHGALFKVLIDPGRACPTSTGQSWTTCAGAERRFKFNNPRERDRCGCGESFPV